MNDEKHNLAGMTLVELMVSMVIGMIVLMALFGVFRLGAESYQATVAQTQESMNAQDSLRMIRQDWARRSARLPLSLGVGARDQGWDLITGSIREWSIDSRGYGVDYEKESDKSWPSDRLGFYLVLSDELSQLYGGKNIAHVWYFTAMAHCDAPEVLVSASDALEGRGFVRNLYRYYTPPDLVFDLLNQGQVSDLEIIPRGPGENGVLSLVGCGVAQFTVALTAQYIVEGGSQVVEGLGDFLSNAVDSKFVMGTGGLHEVLSQTPSETVEGVVPEMIEVNVSVIPRRFIKTLRFDDWDTIVGTESLGREGVNLSAYRALYACKN